MAVTITGGIATLASGGFGLVGIAGGTLTLTPMHPSGATPAVAILTNNVLSEARPQVITLGASGAIPESTTTTASGALKPAGCFHRATWSVGAGTDGEKVLESYDLWIGPDGGTCDVTDPANRVGAGTVPALAGWPDTAPVPVYSSEGTP